MPKMMGTFVWGGGGVCAHRGWVSGCNMQGAGEAGVGSAGFAQGWLGGVVRFPKDHWGGWGAGTCLGRTNRDRKSTRLNSSH